MTSNLKISSKYSHVGLYWHFRSHCRTSSFCIA